MDKIEAAWIKIQMLLAMIGGAIGYYVGEVDGLLTALLVFVCVDYITGVAAAIVEKKLSSEIGFKGIIKKVLIFTIVGLANIIDVNVIQNGSAIRGIVLCFYLSNEGLSILENASRCGLPIPDKLKAILKQLHDKDSDKATPATTDNQQ